MSLLFGGLKLGADFSVVIRRASVMFVLMFWSVTASCRWLSQIPPPIRRSNATTTPKNARTLTCQRGNAGGVTPVHREVSRCPARFPYRCRRGDRDVRRPAGLWRTHPARPGVGIAGPGDPGDWDRTADPVDRAACRACSRRRRRSARSFSSDPRIEKFELGVGDSAVNFIRRGRLGAVGSADNLVRGLRRRRSCRAAPAADRRPRRRSFPGRPAYNRARVRMFATRCRVERNSGETQETKTAGGLPVAIPKDPRESGDHYIYESLRRDGCRENYSLSPADTKPRMMCLWKIRKIRITGSVQITEAASVRPYSVRYDV